MVPGRLYQVTRERVPPAERRPYLLTTRLASILWFNWFLVGCFDVRFVTDSIFERAARTMHLGVMVGFAIVATYFNPDEQTKGTFQAMCG